MEETEILALQMNERYKLFIMKTKDMIQDGIINNKDIEKVKYGIKIPFNLAKYFEYKDSTEIGIFRRRPKSNEILIDNQFWCDLGFFYDELNERDAIMINALIEYYNKDEDSFELDDDTQDRRMI